MNCNKCGNKLKSKDEYCSKCGTKVYPETLTPEIEIWKGLIEGYDPFTGELFNKDHILNNIEVKRILEKAYRSFKFKKKMEEDNPLSKDDLTPSQLSLFEELRKWRTEKKEEEGFFSSYMVFNDRDLINICVADIRSKEDLISVVGIGPVKFEKYADELFEIINEYK